MQKVPVILIIRLIVFTPVRYTDIILLGIHLYILKKLLETKKLSHRGMPGRCETSKLFCLDALE